MFLIDYFQNILKLKPNLFNINNKVRKIIKEVLMICSKKLLLFLKKI